MPALWRSMESVDFRDPRIPRSTRSVSVALLMLGLATVLLFAVALAGRYPLAVGLLDPRSNWARIPGATIDSFAIHLAIYLVATLLYWAAIHLLTRAIEAQVRLQYVGWTTIGFGW